MLDVEYLQFKDDTIRGIQEDEERYAKFQDEIQALEAEIEAENEREARALNDAPTPVPSQRSIEAAESPKHEKSVSHIPQPAESAPATLATTGTPVAQTQPLHPSFDRILPPHSPQRNDYVPVPEQQAFLPGHNGRILPALPGISPMHPSLDLHASHRRTPSGSAPGRGSSLPYPPQQQVQYQQYPPYSQPQHLWPPQQPYPPSHSPHAGQHFYPPGPPHPGMPPSTTPVPPQYQYYPQSAPVNHFNRGQQQPWQVPMPYSPYIQPASAGTTPTQRKDGAPSRIQAPGSSTPWKRKRSNLDGLRVPSPEPPRDVSPFSDVESPPTATKSKVNAVNRKGKARKHDPAPEKVAESRSTRRTRAGSTASSTVDRSSRSQSLASFASDTRPAAGKRNQGSRRIKPEPISTPAPFPSDSEVPKSSGRRQTRGGTLTSHDGPARNNLKRKRDSIQDSSPVPSSPPYHRTQLRRSLQDPNTIAVSKTFSRVASQLLSRVTEHKHASIFARPLSERDAPGYKNLIHRPQDLKSIKAAVTRGSKVAISAIEDAEQEAGEAPTTIQKTEDLVPPKGIVNMDQLEMELMRMFANAVMFNPLPDTERGLGPRRSARLSATPNQAGELGYATSEEGGIVQDARDMCEDVSALIKSFKAMEHDRMEADQS